LVRPLRDAVRRKHPEKWRTNGRFLPHYAPAHRSVVVKDFLEKNMTTLEYPPYSPNLTPTDFYLFPRLKSAWKGRRFCDDVGIIKNATEGLKRYSQNGFQECFQHLYSNQQKCTYANGDYFKGNVAYMIVLFCISQIQSDSRNVLKLPRCLLFLYI